MVDFGVRNCCTLWYELGAAHSNGPSTVVFDEKLVQNEWSCCFGKEFEHFSDEFTFDTSVIV